MFRDKGNRRKGAGTMDYLCMIAGGYMLFLVYQMFTKLAGNVETRHIILAIVMALFGAAGLCFGAYHVFRRRPEEDKTDENGEATP